jgi:ABC-type multidrug transport system ATPase subunit
LATLRLIGVGNRFLKPLDLTVADGSLFVLVGPSGAGKTSLLHILAGLAPHQGRILLDEDEIGHLPPRLRAVGYLSQEPYLFPHMNLDANLDLGMTRLGWNKARRRQRRQELMGLLGIAHLARRDTVTLSGGEKQRVALARVLASGPRLLLLDEPFNQLDFRTARHLRAELKNLQRKLGLTTLMVTHNLEEARELADSLAVIQDGRLTEQEDIPGQGQAFLEVPNLLDCQRLRVLEQGLLELDWHGLRFFALDRGNPDACFKVQPSGIILGKTPPLGPQVNRFRARIAAVSVQHDAAQVECLVNEHMLRVEIHRLRWEREPLAVGDEAHGFIPLDCIQPQ